MKKTLLCLSFFLAQLSLSAATGDGTKENPYTVAELLAQKDALVNTDKTVWVRADLKGLGEDGTATSNADTEDADGKTVKNMAGLFGDETGSFVGYSWQILGQLDINGITSTKNLLIALTYGTTGHAYGTQLIRSTPATKSLRTCTSPWRRCTAPCRLTSPRVCAAITSPAAIVYPMMSLP